MISTALTFELEPVSSLDFGVETPQLDFSTPGFSVVRQAYPAYEGETTVTPSSSRVVLETNEHSLYSNIIIEPIPSNYGRIAWNGSALTVS